MTEREPTGVPGFDDLIEGGLPSGSITLVSGSPGTGKSIFSQQFIYNGATKFNQKGLYISFEQRIPEIYDQATRFGWDFDALEKQKKTRFVFLDITQRHFGDGENYIDVIRNEAMRFKPKRLVIDSLVPLANFPITLTELAHYGFINDIDQLMPLGITPDLLMRMQVHKIITMLKDLNTTSIIVSETSKDSAWLSRDTVSEFMADAVIMMHYLGIGTEANRNIVIEKMRGTKHSEDALPMNITSKGIEVKTAEEAYKI